MMMTSMPSGSDSAAWASFSATLWRTLGVRGISSNLGCFSAKWMRLESVRGIYERLAVVLDRDGAEFGQRFAEGTGHEWFAF